MILLRLGTYSQAHSIIKYYIDTHNNSITTTMYTYCIVTLIYSLKPHIMIGTNMYLGT